MTAKRISTQYDHRKIPIIGLVPESSSSAPSSPVEGQLWLDTSTGFLKVRESGAWERVSNAGVELLANKGAAGGYASLDGSTKVPIAQIPTGTSGSTVPFGNDARFSDQRTPLDDSVTSAKIVDGAIVTGDINAALKDAADGVTSLRQLGYTATKAMPGVARLDQITAPTSAVSIGGQRLTNGAASASSTDFVIRSELDASAQGFAGSKDPARAVSLVNVTIASPGATIDGLTAATNDRYLLRAQTTGTEIGLYQWNGAAVPMTRTVDADAIGEVKDGTLVSIAEGTKAGSLYQQQATPSGAPGAWTQNWTEFQSAIAYTPGNGIDITSFVVSAKKNTVDATNPITVTSDGIGLGTVPIDHGGTGQTTAAAAIVAIGGMRRSTGLLAALTAGVEVNYVHGLNTLYPLEPSFQLVADSSYMEISSRVVDANTIGVTADEPYLVSTVRAIVVG